jgi:hypothetical protein
MGRLRGYLERSPDRALRVVALACGVLALVLALGAYTYGKKNRFDHWIPEVIEYENVKVAAAISDLVYGFERGYAAHTQVYDALRRGGMTVYPEFLEPLGVKYPHNLSDQRLLNKALADASQLGTLRSSRRIMEDVKPVEPIDLGMVDYYKYAFQVFGIKIQALFRFYFLLHLATIALFTLAYWRQAEAMLAMLAIVAGHLFAQIFLVAGVPPEMIFGVATPYSYRFVTVVGALSALHIALAVLWPPRASAASVAALVGQIAILFFVSTMRRSALWEILWPAAIAAGFLALVFVSRWGALKRWPKLDSAPSLLRRGLSWPALTFAVLFVVLQAAHNAKVDAAYRFSDEWMPHHPLWYSVFVGFSSHPHWKEGLGREYTDAQGELRLGDDLAIAGAEKWLELQYGISKDYLVSPIYGYKYRTLERVLQEASIDFVKKNPRFILELQLIHKPLRLIKDYVRWNIRIVHALPAWVFGLLAAAGMLFVAGYAALGWTSSPYPGQIAALLGLGAVLAVLPGAIIFPSYSTMADQALIVNTAIAAWLGAGIAGAASRYRSARQNVTQRGVSLWANPYRPLVVRLAVVALAFPVLYRLIPDPQVAQFKPAEVREPAIPILPANPRSVWQKDAKPEAAARPGRVVNKLEQDYRSVPEIFAVMPTPDAIPDANAGHAIMSRTLKPASVGNLIRVRASCEARAENQANEFVMALYRDSTTIRAGLAPVQPNHTAKIDLVYEARATLGVPHQYIVRVGVGREGKLKLNPSSKGCSLSVEELAPSAGAAVK